VATAGDQINRALRLLGVLAEGESPSTSETADSLAALNQMLDSWSTERLAVYSTTDLSVTWPASTASRTLGPTGQLVGARPVKLDHAYYVVGGISYPVKIVNKEQYDSIPLKTTTSTLPEYLYINMAYPDTTVTLYPVPSQELAFHFVYTTALTEPATSGTTLSIPPGYLRAFTYNLALEIAPEFGVEPPQDVRRIAVASKRNLKRINNPSDVMSVPGTLLGHGCGGNIYTGWQ